MYADPIHVEKLVREVQAQTPLAGKDIPIVADYHIQSPAGAAMPAPGQELNGPVMVFNPNYLIAFNDLELKSIIAHEFGHIVNGDVYIDPSSLAESRKFEDRADRYAVKLGYGQAMIDAFASAEKHFERARNPPKTHSSIKQRIDNLRRWMQEDAAK